MIVKEKLNQANCIDMKNLFQTIVLGERERLNWTPLKQMAKTFLITG